jgi:hypothetical protein
MNEKTYEDNDYDDLACFEKYLGETFDMNPEELFNDCSKREMVNMYFFGVKLQQEITKAHAEKGFDTDR